MSEQGRDRALKESVSAVYETDTFNSFLRDALHPGGLELTRKIAEIALFDKHSTVLDIACGKGGTPLLLAQEYDCNVIGIDLSDKMIALAQSRTEAERLNGKVKLVVADAEELPFEDATFDTILSECSFSILPNKEKAASEMNRTLKANGRLVITDIILRGRVPPETQSELKPACQAAFPLLPCIVGAMPVKDYIAILERAGFQNPYIEDHSIQLKKLGYQMGITFGGWEGFLQRLSSELLSHPKTNGGLDFSVEAYRRLFTQGRPGYALIIVSKP